MLTTYILFMYLSQYGGKMDWKYKLSLHNSNSHIPKNVSIRKNSKLWWNDKSNRTSNRENFYPHYGASGIRRNTNLYRNGKSKGKLKKETRLQRNTRLDMILSNHNKLNK